MKREGVFLEQQTSVWKHARIFSPLSFSPPTDRHGPCGAAWCSWLCSWPCWRQGRRPRCVRVCVVLVPARAARRRAHRPPTAQRAPPPLNSLRRTRYPHTHTLQDAGDDVAKLQVGFVVCVCGDERARAHNTRRDATRLAPRATGVTAQLPPRAQPSAPSQPCSTRSGLG
jgi:hypothetical protein